MQNLPITWAKTSLIFLAIAMLIGVYLRMSFFYAPIAFYYKYLLHTHSHIVLLGWAFNAVAALLYYQYKEYLNPKKCKILFVLFQISILGMMFSFPLQGYALYSIIFSTMHILVSYFFVAHFMRATKSDMNIAAKFVRLGFIFYLISTLGPFSLGPIIANGGSHTPLYDLAIYFYLHFFYNGFFTLAILGIFLKSIHAVTSPNSTTLNRIYRYLGYAIAPSYVLSIYCYFTFGWLYAIGIISGVWQLVGFYYLLLFLKENRESILNLYRSKIKFLFVGLIAFGFKLTLQLFSALPFSTDIICNAHPLIIAYLHVVFIGFITFSLLGLIFHNKLVSIKNGRLNWGFFILLIGFLFSELFIALSIFPFWNSFISGIVNFHLIFSFSVVMLVGVLILINYSETEP